MGILNTTPDSFSDGGKFIDLESAVRKAKEMIEQGASIIDVGGESTRPGAQTISEEEECRRTLPVVSALHRELREQFPEMLISIDTSKAGVAQGAIEVGADIINDVTALEGDSEMINVCRDSDAGIVVMHMQGKPESMQDAPSYDHVTSDIYAYIEARLAFMASHGIDLNRVCIDPGVGFGKTTEQNKTLIRELGVLEELGRPILLGVSRKSIIGDILSETDPMEREWGTVALTALGRKMGASVFRVHEVQGNNDALRMMDAIFKK